MAVPRRSALVRGWCGVVRRARDDVAIDPGVVVTLVALRDSRRGDILGALRRHM